jgi:hypothetical protein
MPPGTIFAKGMTGALAKINTGDLSDLTHQGIVSRQRVR